MASTLEFEPSARLTLQDEQPAKGNGARPSAGLKLGWLMASVGFLIGSRPIGDNSFLTHLATGRLMVERGAIPKADPYSSLGLGEAWTVQSWLPSLLYATAESVLGLWSITILHGLIAAAVLGTVWHLTSEAGALLARVGLTSIVAIPATVTWSSRPFMFGLLAMAIMMAVAKRPATRPTVAIMTIVFGIWINSHGSFVLGWALLAMMALGAGIDDRRWPRRELTYLVAAIGGVALGAMHPVGARLVWFPVHMLMRREVLDGVQEWNSPRFGTWQEYVFLLTVVLIVIAAARGARWRALIPSVVMSLGGLLAVRNISVACVVVVAINAPSLAGMFNNELGAAGTALSRAVQGLAISVLAVSMWSVVSEPAIDLRRYPVEEVDWMLQRQLVASPDISVGHREYVGNYLTYRFGSKARVFVDDRYDFHAISVIKDHKALVEGTGVAEVLDSREFDVLVWPSDSHVGELLEYHPGWRIAHSGDHFVVACRTTSPAYHRCEI